MEQTTEQITVRFDPTTPDREDVLELLGVPRRQPLSTDSENLLADALQTVARLSEPRGTYRLISKTDFARIFQGEGLNDYPNPVDQVYRQARCLALFALTVGIAVSERIHQAFVEKDYASGYMLDSVASVLADQMADQLQSRFEAEVAANTNGQFEEAALRYSPGYCGWHLSGQGRLFGYLQPSRIGISLNDSYLMSPMKSVSGVILVGRPEIHYFENDYGFCDQCKTKSCRARIRSLKVRQGILVWPPPGL